jgi:hypothetical protein
VSAVPIHHVYPLHDLAEHVTDGAACWCAPVTKREGLGFIIVHNALDGRASQDATERPSS